MKRFNHFSLLAIIALLATNQCALANTLELIIDDMHHPHDAKPEGVPKSYSWSQRPTVHHLDQISPDLLDRFHAIVAWGQVYVAENSISHAKNVRVEVRNIKAYELTRKNRSNKWKWHLAQAHPKVIGAAYSEDFSMNFSKHIDLREEPDGGVSAKLIPGYNFHFFAPRRAPFDPKNTLGIFTTFQARLIVDNPMLPDDRDKAHLIANAGCDVWESLDSRMHGNAQPNVGIGRFKFLTKKWQSFNMISLTTAQIRKYPPPIE